MKPALPADKALRRLRWFFPVVFLVLAFSIGTAGILFLRRQQISTRQAIQNELAAIADLKVRQIVNWRNERLDDARFFAKAFFVARDVQAFFSDASSETTRAEILNWLMQLKAGDRYSQVALFDSRLNPRLAIPPWTNTLSPPMLALMAAVLQTNDVVLTDLHFGDTTNDIYVDLAFPVFAPRTLSETAPVPLGVIVLRLDPFKFLYPLVQSWPTPSQTAETLLVRREGDQVLFLNELRHRQQTALKLRLPLDSNPQLLAAWAVLRREGVVEGKDYRGVPVLGAIGPIPGTPWFIVAKVDQAEIYAPLRQQALFTGIIILVFLLVVVLSLSLYGRHQSAVFLRRELALERERKVLAERFQHLMQCANDIILLTDLDGRIQEANERALEAYGTSLAELQGRHLVDLCAPAVRVEFPRQAEQVLAQGSAVFETVQQRKDGSTFPVEMSDRLVEIGGVQYKLSLIRDVTQRKKTENALQSAKDFAENLIATANTMIVGLDTEGNITLLNQAAEEITGYQRAELSGRNWFEVLVPKDRYPDVWDEFHRLLSGGLPKHFENPILTKAGQERYIVWQNNERRELGRIVGTISFGMDITKRRDRLKRAEIVDSVSRILVDLTLDYSATLEAVAIELSRQMGDACGLSLLSEDRQEIKLAAFHHADPEIGAGMRPKMITGYLPADTGLMACVLRTGEPLVIAGASPSEWRAAIRLEFPQYVDRPALPNVILVPLRAQGRVIGVLTLLRDPHGKPYTAEDQALLLELADRTALAITNARLYAQNQHQAELLQKANVELEERVQQRTAELAAANTELESFAFSVSHDLRAPLRGIDGWSLALLEDYDDQLDARAKGYLQTVRSETQRMGQLIDALLELSRVTRQDMQHVTVNLSELAHGIAADLHRAESGRHVDFCIAPDLVVHGDPILLRAALDNLLGNAWKFTAQRSQARIEFGQTLRESQPVFFIRDNGAGFDMHNASRLFAPFQRLHRKDQFPGTGIGLATVRRILNRHLGRIWAEGEVDHGAVFFFTLGLSTAGKP